MDEVPERTYTYDELAKEFCISRSRLKNIVTGWPCRDPLFSREDFAVRGIGGGHKTIVKQSGYDKLLQRLAVKANQ